MNQSANINANQVLGVLGKKVARNTGRMEFQNKYSSTVDTVVIIPLSI